jgi:hypothetical protein
MSGKAARHKGGHDANLLDSYWRMSENNLRKLEEVEEAEKVLRSTELF